MSLLFVDGFDSYATADGLKKWNAFGTGVTINASGGRRGSGAVSFAIPARFIQKILPSAYATLIVGWAHDVVGGNTAAILKLIDGAAVHVSLYVTANNAIAAYRGDLTTLLGTSANSVVPASGYFYIECKVFISDTVGTVDVRINGASVLSLTNQDTRNAGNASCTGFYLFGVGTIAFADDLYVCDTAGSTNNNFLGDCRVDTIYPTSDGTYAAWTPSTGTSHFAMVDETTPNTTDYNSGTTAGDRDSYGMGDLPPLVSQIVYGLQVNAAILKDDAGVKTAATFVRSGSTDSADGATVALSTSQAYMTQIFEQDPAAAAAWTETTVNSMQAGIKVIA